MKKIVLSAVAALTIGSVAALASEVQFYTDANGQVFTQEGEGRTALENKSTSWYAHADKLKFNALAYLGYVNTDLRNDNQVGGNTSEFELRRMYFQVKAHLLEDPKSYFRVTMDATTKANDTSPDTSKEEYQAVIIKYAYLYLNEVLPFTGVEIGVVHRPWIDYEEHNAWFYRNIAKVFVEADNSAHLTNSADLGVNFKTSTPYFSSEIGMFNGEGYHNAEDGAGNSLEWRATAHILGTGKKQKDKFASVTYWDASFFGQYNVASAKHQDSATPNTDDLVWGGLHTVFNMPAFMLSGQYIKSQDTSDNATPYKYSGSGYSVHTVARFGAGKDYAAFGRYDSFTSDLKVNTKEQEKRTYIVGASWQQNKNIQWIANITTTDIDQDSSKNGNAYMLSAQVEF
ncbi:hypothetical protein KKG72_02280 [bacterium]|nr:hypothetical protein [bacterium]MBU1995011.1 hypothetical protein [bacterium]